MYTVRFIFLQLFKLLTPGPKSGGVEMRCVPRFLNPNLLFCSRSEGYLCLPKHYSEHIEEAVRKIAKGSFYWFLRKRLRITLIGEGNHEGLSPFCPTVEVALKDTFLAPDSTERFSGKGTEV